MSPELTWAQFLRVKDLATQLKNLMQGVQIHSLYSDLALNTASPTCQEYLLGVGTDHIFSALLHNKQLSPAIRDALTAKAGEFKTYTTPTNNLWIEHLPELEAIAAKSVTGGEVMTGSNYLDSKYFANMALLTLLTCPKFLDQYGTPGWELFFEMLDAWSGDLLQLPAVVATLLANEAKQ